MQASLQLGPRRIWAVAVVALLLDGCSTVGCYAQAVNGGLGVLNRRRSIEKVLADPQTPRELEQRLRLVLDIREFAESGLELPVGDSYGSYVDLGRPYAVWTVTAAEELSVEPVVWCFLVAGCVSYRGYFSEEQARRFADKLAKKGLETDVGGVAAYSTLGWFEDPVLNTFLNYSDAELAGLLFHELAHRRIYVKDDTTFNESFATAVELEAVRRWLEQGEGTLELTSYRQRKERDTLIADIVVEHQRRLAEIFAENRPIEWKRKRKTEIYAVLRQTYLEHSRSWDGDSRWDAWFGEGLNNARLASVGAYHELVPAFEVLLDRHRGDLGAFYEEVEQLAELPNEERRERLE